MGEGSSILSSLSYAGTVVPYTVSYDISSFFLPVSCFLLVITATVPTWTVYPQGSCVCRAFQGRYHAVLDPTMYLICTVVYPDVPLTVNIELYSTDAFHQNQGANHLFYFYSGIKSHTLLCNL